MRSYPEAIREQAWRLYKLQRFVHLVVAPGNAKHAWHFLLYYGWAGGRGNGGNRARWDMNESALQCILQIAGSLGAVPIMIVEDLNVETEESDVLAHALGTN